MERIIDILYQAIIATNTRDFVKSCDPDDYSKRELQHIAWEYGKYGLECSGEEWHTAINHIKSQLG